MTKNFNDDSLADWLAYLASPSRHRVDLGLERIRRVARSLDLLRWDCPVISVAGTNGKGSTVAILEAIYMAQGYRVACYTSPHLIHFNERMRINGTSVSDLDLCQVFRTIVSLDSAALELTYFEFVTLAALQYFKQQSIDVLILEVGLGGRLDATNIIDADLAIVTSIGIDHCHFLGDTRELIAGEKAGIFRSGRLAVCGDPEPPQSLKTVAAKQGSHLECIGQDFKASQQTDTWTFESYFLRLSKLPLPSLLINNVALAVHAVSRLSKRVAISEKAIRDGLQTVDLPGRCQWVSGTINHIYDVAHNPHACERLAYFAANRCQQGKIHAVMSMLKDKDVAASVEPLLPLVDSWHVASLDDQRGASLEQLTLALEDPQAKDVSQYDSLVEAYQRAYSDAQPGDCVIIFGSFVTVAELINYRVYTQNR